MVRAIIGLLFLLGFALPAHAQSGPAQDSLYGTPSEGRWSPFFADLPACDDSGVLSTVISRFGQTETIYWGGKYAIEGFERVREIGFRSNGLSYIPRRYCVAIAQMNDERRTRPVVYWIGANSGIIGLGWGVQWCVVGLDRVHAYAPDCEVLRPILERWIGEYKWLATYGLKARY
jgi:hypothetical protein